MYIEYDFMKMDLEDTDVRTRFSPIGDEKEDAFDKCFTIDNQLSWCARYVKKMRDSERPLKEFEYAELKRFALAADAIRANIMYAYIPSRYVTNISKAYAERIITFEDCCRLLDVANYVAALNIGK